MGSAFVQASPGWGLRSRIEAEVHPQAVVHAAEEGTSELEPPNCARHVQLHGNSAVQSDRICRDPGGCWALGRISAVTSVQATAELARRRGQQQSFCTELDPDEVKPCARGWQCLQLEGIGERLRFGAAC